MMIYVDCASDIPEHRFNLINTCLQRALKPWEDAGNNLAIDVRYDIETCTEFDAYGMVINYKAQRGFFTELIIDPRIKIPTLFRVVFHEAAHIGQFIDGKIETYWTEDGGVVVWEGKEYCFETSCRITSPWELDAIYKENRWVREFANTPEAIDMIYDCLKIEKEYDEIHEEAV